MKTNQLPTILAGLVLALGQHAAAQTSDQVFPISGTSMKGMIKPEQSTSAALALDMQGVVRKIPVTDIRRVIMMGEPREMSRARDSILSGQLETGYAELRKIDPNSLKRAIVKADLQYYLAFSQGKIALRSGGDKGGAVKAMMTFMRANATSHHYFEGAELLGDLAVALESYDNAAKYYKILADTGPSADYKMRGSVLMGRAQLSQNKYAEAIIQFDKVMALSVDTQEAQRQKLFAQVGKAECLLKTGKPDEGITIIEGLIKDHSPEENKELFGRAYNALGTSYLASGKQKEALLAFLHVDILFYSNADVHAEALYNLSNIWADIKKPDRANDARSLLTDRYAGSAWSKKKRQ